MNQITLMGRLATEPQYRTMSTGKSVTSFVLAVPRPNKKDEADFITCETWMDQQGNFIRKYFQKGSPMVITGSLRVNRKDDKTYHSVICDRVEFTIERPQAARSGGKTLDVSHPGGPFTDTDSSH